jgi:hypothetical protein
MPSCSSEPDRCRTERSCASDDDCGTQARCVGNECVRLNCLRDGESCGFAHDACESQVCSGPPGGNGVCTSGLILDGRTCRGPVNCVSGDCHPEMSVCVTRSGPGTPCIRDVECMPGLFCWRRPCGNPEGTCSVALQAGQDCCRVDVCEGDLRCRKASCDSAAVPTYCGASPLVGDLCCEDSDCASVLGCDQTTNECL